VERLRPIFLRGHTVCLLARDHEQFYRPEHGDKGHCRSIVQPINRGTAVAIVVALLRIVRFDDLGRAERFLELLQSRIRMALRFLETMLTHGDLCRTYRRIRALDLSLEVLALQPEPLVVLRDAAAGWADFGTPARASSGKSCLQPAGWERRPLRIASVRERTDRTGAKLAARGRLGEGTKVEITVPEGSHSKRLPERRRVSPYACRPFAADTSD